MTNYLLGLNFYRHTEPKLIRNQNDLQLFVHLNRLYLITSFFLQDEGFFGVGEEHQSAALNVIAVLFGTDGKKESPFKHLLRIKDEEQDDGTPQQHDEAGDFTVQFEMDMDSSEKCDDTSGGTGNGSSRTGSRTGSCSDIPSSSDHESLPRDPCSSDSINELFESLTGCAACSQLQQTDNNNIGATSHINSAFVTAAATGLCDHICSAGGGGASQWPRGDPLYRRRSSGIVTTTTTSGNIPSIPKSTENQVPDDRPDSGDLNLQELFGSFSAASETQQQQQKLNAECEDDSLTLQNQSSIITSSSTSSISVKSNNSNNSFSLPSNNSGSGSRTTTSRLPSNHNTFSLNSSNRDNACLNSANSDCSAFGTHTLPVVVVATGMGLDRKSSATETDKDDQSLPKATFHWTLDDSNCQEDAGEALLSPLVMEPSELGEVIGTAIDNSTVFSFSHVQEGLMEEPKTSGLELLGNPEMLSSLCLSQLGEENDIVRIELPQVGDSPERAASLPSPSVLTSPGVVGTGGGGGLDHAVADDHHSGGGESLVSPLVVHHLEVQQPRHVRGSSLSSDDGDGVDPTLCAAGPRIDSAELRLNLDFILDNSDDDDDHDHSQHDHDVISGATCACNLDLSYHGSHHQNEGPSDLDLDPHDPEVFQDLASELKLNLDFIDDEDQPGDLSLEDVFISEPSPPGITATTIQQQQQQQQPQVNSIYTGCGPLETIHSGQISSSSATTTTASNICDTTKANCESKINDNGKGAVVNCVADHNNSLLWFLSGDFEIWSSVFENVTARSPHHFWPAQFTSQVSSERSGSVTCLSLDGSDLCRGSWSSSNGSSLFFNPLNPWGTTWLPISPRREEHNDQTTSSTAATAACRPTSRLWDVNLQKISSSEFESPRERCSTIENIQRYLMNLR